LPSADDVGQERQLFRLAKMLLLMDVPVQFFQSVIAIELAVTGALLWQMPSPFSV
jgi:hypothetical protein